MEKRYILPTLVLICLLILVLLFFAIQLDCNDLCYIVPNNVLYAKKEYRNVIQKKYVTSCIYMNKTYEMVIINDVNNNYEPIVSNNVTYLPFIYECTDLPINEENSNEQCLVKFGYKNIFN